MAKNRTTKKDPPPLSETNWTAAFLSALSQTANVQFSCKAAGIGRQTAYDRREKDNRFRDAWDTAIEDACDELEKVARDRAKNESDTLLIFLLKAHRPQKYREKYEHRHAGPDGGPVQIKTIVVTRPPLPGEE